MKAQVTSANTLNAGLWKTEWDALRAPERRDTRAGLGSRDQPHMPELVTTTTIDSLQSDDIIE